MKSFQFLATLVVVQSCAQSSWAQQFERVLHLPGKGMDFPAHVGTYDASVELGFQPDLLVPVCGGGLGSALIQAFPDMQKRLDFMRSERMLGLANQITIDTGQPYSDLKEKMKAWFLSKGGKGDQTTFPNYDTAGVTRGTEAFFEMPEFNVKLSDDNGPSVIVIGFELTGKAREGAFKHESGEPPVMQEVWFMSPRTAERVRQVMPGLPCAVKKDHPSSWICDTIKIETDFTAGEIARITSSDQFVFSRPKIKGRVFFTGGGDLYPSDSLRAMGKTVIAEFPPEFDTMVTAPAVWEAFGYDGNERIRKYAATPFDYWIDQSDYVDLFTDGLGLNPRIKPQFLPKLDVTYTWGIARDLPT